MFGALKNVIVAAAAALALVPGASLMTGAIELPIEFNAALGYMAAFVGPIVFFVVFLAKPWLLRLGRGLLIGAIIAPALGGLALGYWTNGYAQAHSGKYRYIDHTGQEQVEHYIIPDRYGEKLEKNLPRDGRNLDNLLKRDRAATLKLLHQDSTSARLKMTLGFLVAQALLIFAFLCAAWAVALAATTEQDKVKARTG